MKYLLINIFFVALSIFSLLVENISEKLKKLAFSDEVKANGGKIYSVGGAVRDEFLGKESKDLDILITGVPYNKLIEILSSYGKVDLVGKSFGIIKFKAIGETEDIDIAIPREERKITAGHTGFEVKADHDLPIEVDMGRRDFSINAIAKDIDGNIVDPFNGIEDLNNKIIRVLHEKSFFDDPLRMLRAVQFAARFNFKIEPETLKLIKKNVKLIKEISGERILTELEKIVSKGNIVIGGKLLEETGLYNKIFGKHFKDFNDLNNVKNIGDFIFILLKQFENPDKIFIDKLKGDINTAKYIKALNLTKQESSDDLNNKLIVFRMYNVHPESIKSEVLPDTIKRFSKEFINGKYPKTFKELDIDGNDLINLGFKGKEVGDKLKEILINILDNKLENNKKKIVASITKKNEIVENKGIAYSGVVLDENSRTLILNKFSDLIPEDWKVIAHHMTTKLGKLPDELKNRLNEKIELTATEIGISDRAIALKIEGFPSEKPIPHITIAINQKAGAKPVDSNKIEKWKKIKLFKIYGMVAEVPFKTESKLTLSSLLFEAENEITSLSFFDFDGTLVNSPEPEFGKKEYEKITGKPYPHIGWWSKQESLEPFDIKRFEVIYKEYLKYKSNLNNINILLTNRLRKLEPIISEILNKNGYHFTVKTFADDGENKANRVLKILENYPNVKIINVYDDRDSEITILSSLKEHFKNIGIEYNLFQHRDNKLTKI